MNKTLCFLIFSFFSSLYSAHNNEMDYIPLSVESQLAPIASPKIKDSYIENLQNSFGGYAFNTLATLRLSMAFSPQQLADAGFSQDEIKLFHVAALSCHAEIMAVIKWSSLDSSSTEESRDEIIRTLVGYYTYAFNPSVFNYLLDIPCQFCENSPIHLQAHNVNDFINLYQDIINQHEISVTKQKQELNSIKEFKPKKSSEYYTAIYGAIEYFSSALIENFLPQDATVLFLGRTPIPILYTLLWLQKLQDPRVASLKLKHVYFSGSADTSFFDDNVTIIDPHQIKFYFDYLKTLEWDPNLKEFFIVDYVLTGSGLEAFTTIFNAFWKTHYNTSPPLIKTLNLENIEKEDMEALLADNVSIDSLISSLSSNDVRDCCFWLPPVSMNSEDTSIYDLEEITRSLANDISEEVSVIYFPPKRWCSEYSWLFNLSPSPTIIFHQQKAYEIAVRIHSSR